MDSLRITPERAEELRRLHAGVVGIDPTLTDGRLVAKHAIAVEVAGRAVPARIYLDRTDSLDRTHHDKAAICDHLHGDAFARSLAEAHNALPDALADIDTWRDLARELAGALALTCSMANPKPGVCPWCHHAPDVAHERACPIGLTLARATALLPTEAGR